MNVLFCTQSESLKLFDALGSAMKKTLPLKRMGFIVADSMAYDRWLLTRPGFEDEQHELLKEWEVTSRPFGKPDLEKLARYEVILGGKAGLFGAIVADRRLFMGPDCTFTQDYRRRFSDDELLFILQRGIERVEELFDRLKPDLVLSFISVTMLDYLVYLVAKARGIRILNLRPTRISDRVSFSEILNDPSPELTKQYHSLLAGKKSLFTEDARQYISRVREKHGRYEGVIPPSDKPAQKFKISKLLRFNQVILVIRNYLHYKNSVSASDNHVPNPLRRFYFTVWRNPNQARRTSKFFQNHYIHENDLNKLRYVFFPLHTEPEVSLLVYGRPYINQIEIIRMIAMSLPINTFMIVKEHPWMVGKRSLAAYQKIIDIPKVKFAHPALEARTLIKKADLVAVVTGSIALEAAMLGKPVITFGDCPYNLLPDTMVIRCIDPRNLQEVIKNAINNYKVDDDALLAYVAAVFQTSVSVNLYSVLLGKNNVYAEKTGLYSEEIKKLLGHLEVLLKQSSSTILPGSAAW
jgi:Capsule polysaccharide biosynthesis protein